MDDENDDFREKIKVRKLNHYGVSWTPRALLCAQKHSGNIPGWLLSDFGTSENCRKFIESDPDFDTKALPPKSFVDGFG